MTKNNTNMSEEYKNISSSTSTGTNKTLTESDNKFTHNRIWISNITICTIYNTTLLQIYPSFGT